MFSVEDCTEFEEFYAPFRYVCVVDFEATCVQEKAYEEFYPHEIIEFPAVLIDAHKRKIIGTYHSFVRPLVNTKLSAFCKKLTGISQDTVDNAPTFDIVYSKFLDWLYDQIGGQEFTLLTDGVSDTSKFLFLQCLMSQLTFPNWAEHFIDIKCTFGIYANKSERTKLVEMLRFYGLKFEGKLHSGKDDAFNIARLTLKMLECGYKLLPNACNTQERLADVKNHTLLFPSYVAVTSCDCGLLQLSDKRRLQHGWTKYLRRKRDMRTRSNRKSNRSEEKSNDEDLASEIIGEMDLDPDLIGCESVLLKHKSK